MAEIHGLCEERFSGVRNVLAANLDAGKDVGACACVLLDGETVVDIWGGTTDVDGSAQTPWQRDTIINVWSTTKTMTALSALLLADRGELDLHAPVARYWPEFAAAGKERVEVRHLLGHAAGLSGWSEPMQPADLYDWDLCCERLAAQEPWWEPGTASGYHAITQGYLVGEVVRRVTGLSVGSFFAKELAGPLNADFHIGTPPECDDRVAFVIPPPPLDALAAGLDPASIPIRTLSNPILDATQSREAAWRRAEIPAAGGHGNARSVAAVQAVVAGRGSVAGTRVLSEAGVDAIFETVAHGTDLVLGVPLHFGMGYGIIGDDLPLLPPGSRACFWGGWGGSVVVCDLDHRMVVSYVMNKMGEGTLGDDRGVGIVAAAFAAVAAG